MSQAALKVFELSRAFLLQQKKFVESHPGDEEILIQKLYDLTTPTFLEVIVGLQSLEEKYGEAEIDFLIKQFARSLTSIQEADMTVQRSFFYNSLDQFLNDLKNVVHTGLLSQQKQKPSETIASILMEKQDPLLDFAY